MTYPKVSIIIPAYNQAGVLGEAIQSALGQTYPHLEVIVVNDASPDNTDEVVRRFNDPRLRYIVHSENRMLAAARNTGIRASNGDIIALLDADDLFHPEKIRAHMDFLERHPHIGVSYNARFSFWNSAKNVTDLWRPPLSVDLSDLVMGFPFAPSDMVIRREWLTRVDLFDESYTHYSEDLDINCRLALAGCEFAGVNRALNYRRYHPARKIQDLSERSKAALRALEKTFSDPRCPLEVVDLRRYSLASQYLGWAYYAFAQDETVLGQTCVRNAFHNKETLGDGMPSELVESFLDRSSADESVDPEAQLEKIFSQLPPERQPRSGQLQWAIARGYLLRAVRAVIWDKPNKADEYFALAAARHVQIDESSLQYMTAHLLSYEAEFGTDASQIVLRNLTRYLTCVGRYGASRRLSGSYWVNRAFQNYRGGDYECVVRNSLRGVSNDPTYLANRGLWSISLRSLMERIR